ncbi:MAG: hypothetical protein IJO48_00795 [Clostridia bacterium]|nr:hypothetical protein [Clostridia bacterium]
MSTLQSKLIVSTQKENKTIKFIGIIGCLFVLALTIFIISMPAYQKKEMAYELFGNTSLSWLFPTVMGIISIYYCGNVIINSFLAQKSYCAVYENKVSGITALNMKESDKALQTFEVKYDEILNVTEAGKKLCIYTAYATYDVLAMTNREEALKEIKARMCGKK